MQSSFKFNYDINHPATISSIDDLPLWSAQFGVKLLEKINYHKHIKVLDIGSGNGFPALELASRLGETCEVIGIDPWKEANDRVRQKIETWGIKNLKIIEGYAENIPFDDNYFDLIISNNGINNVDNDKITLNEIARVSKIGSQLVVTVNLPDSFHQFYSIYKLVLAKLQLDEFIKKVDEHIYKKRKPIDYTTALIEDTGFKIDECEESKFEFKYTDGTSFLNHFFIKLAFIKSWIDILPSDKVDEVFAEVEKQLNEVAESNKGLTMTIPFICINAKKL